VAKKLYLHIGNPKTGTTAIQRFCYENHTLLKDQNIFYPIRYCHESGPHYEVTWAIDENNQSFFQSLLAEFESSRCSSLLISSEMFSTPRYQSSLSVSKTLRMFRDIGFKLPDIHSILYIRRQDEYYESIYNERVKNHGLTKRIMETAAPLDYSFILGIWSEFIGVNNVKCLQYSSGGGSIIGSFCDAIGYQITGNEKKLGLDVNLKMYPLELEIIRNLNKCRIPMNSRNELNEYVRNVVGLVLTESEKGNMSLLSEAEQKEVLARYSMINDYISNKYFSGNAIFSDKHTKTSSVISEERVIEIMSQIITHLWQERSTLIKAGE
tara:strand:+ start:380 stop:1351 length:972 start_codon:yes stop_codon:yes gene_type:complete